ncbi:MAG: thioredoxin [Candidatus Buchananbacteria bacterium]|nr:thioredoxin [Candidatus Buchananbacteria bacterium]
MSERVFTDANFEAEVLKSDKPVLVDFYAEWCGPCKLQDPIVEEVAEALGDTAVVGKLDVDANTVAQRYGVMSIPTLMIFKNGEPVETMVGVHTKEALVEKLKKAA